MNTLSKILVVTFALGFSYFSAADTPINPDCKMDGQFNLRLAPWGGDNVSPNWLYGNIDSKDVHDNVQWAVTGFIQFGDLRVQGFYRGMNVSLQIHATQDAIDDSQWIEGTIGSTPVMMSGHMGMFSAPTGCLK